MPPSSVALAAVRVGVVDAEIDEPMAGTSAGTMSGIIIMPATDLSPSFHSDPPTLHRGVVRSPAEHLCVERLGCRQVPRIRLVPAERAGFVGEIRPMNVFGCQTPIATPVGSANTAILPMSETSMGSMNTMAPAFLARSTTSSAFSTET